ncbi:hypothetical protein Tco_1320152 [Tanacetum coccineum]
MSQPANDEFSQHLIDDEASNHKDASDTGTAPKQKQQVIPQTTAISNIKLPILKKEEISTDIWCNLNTSIITGAEIQAVEKERKAKNILLMAIPKEHMRRFSGIDQKKSGKAHRTRVLVLMQIKKIQKLIIKLQFEAFTISISKRVRKGYDRFQQNYFLSWKLMVPEVSTKMQINKFLRSLPPCMVQSGNDDENNPRFDTLSL